MHLQDEKRPASQAPEAHKADKSMFQCLSHLCHDMAEDCKDSEQAL